MFNPFARRNRSAPGRMRDGWYPLPLLRCAELSHDAGDPSWGHDLTVACLDWPSDSRPRDRTVRVSEAYWSRADCVKRIQPKSGKNAVTVQPAPRSVHRR
jgi:hypothetical protein